METIVHMPDSWTRIGTTIASPYEPEDVKKEKPWCRQLKLQNG